MSLIRPPAAPSTAPDLAELLPPPVDTRPVRRRRYRWRYALTVLAFLLPSAIPLAMFTLYPMVGALWTSLHEWNLLAPMQWVGLDNYAHLIHDPDTQRAFFASADATFFAVSTSCPSSPAGSSSRSSGGGF